MDGSPGSGIHYISQFIRQIPDFCNEPIQCLESLIEALNILGKITPAILDGIQPVVELLGLEEFRFASISLRYEHEKSSRDLYRIGCDVIDLIKIVESLHEMVDDEERIEKIRAEVRNQIEKETTHFDRKDVGCFPELIQFLNDVLARVRKVESLSENIDKNFNNLSTRNEKAENEAEKQENAAWLRKYFAGTFAAFSLYTVVWGLSSVERDGASGAAFCYVGLGGIVGIASCVMLKTYEDKEKKFRKTKCEFKTLHKAASDLQIITCKIQQGIKVLKNKMEINFTRELEQPPLLTYIEKSLAKIFTALRFERVNFSELKERASRLLEFQGLDD